MIASSKYGKKAHKQAKFVANVYNKSRTEGTKKNYVSSIRQWLLFNLEFEWNPFFFPLPVEKVVLFIADRMENGSISTLNRHTAALRWLCECFEQSIAWRSDSPLTTFLAKLHDQYDVVPDERLPLSFHILLQWIQRQMVRSTEGDKIGWNRLVKVLIALLYAFTASRGSELLPYKQKGSVNGIRIGDLALSPQTRIWSISVRHAKNLKTKRTPKVIHVGPTNCGNTDCRCTWLDPAKLLSKHIKLRRKRGRQDPRFQLNSKSTVFLWADGKPVTVANLGALVKTIVYDTETPEHHRYSMHSFRIGSTTEMAMAGVPTTKIYKYVGWSDKSLLLIMKKPTLTNFVPWSKKDHGCREC